MQAHILSIVLFGISSNIDNFIAGLSYGIRKKYISWTSGLLVALISLLGTMLSMIFGKSLMQILPANFAAVLGSSIVIIIGAVGLLRYICRRGAEAPGEKAACSLSVRELLLLGAALAINNTGLGVGASMTGLRIIPTSLCSFVCSMLLLYAGNRLGCARMSGNMGKFAEPVASMLMILLGIYELFI